MENIKYYLLNVDEYEIPRECVVRFEDEKYSTVFPLERGFKKSDFDRRYIGELFKNGEMNEDEISEATARKLVKSFDRATEKYAKQNNMQINTWFE